MKISSEFKIGFWAIVTLVTLYLGINFLKGKQTFRQGQFFYLVCDKVDGLAISSHVKLHGLKVGMVRSLDYDEKTDHVVVTLNVYDKSLRIPKDSRVSIQTELLGTANVILEMGDSTAYYQNWDTIYAPAAAPGLMEKADPIITSVEALMPKVDTLITGINVLVNESKLHESLLDINTLTTHLNTTVNELNRLLHKDVPAVMSNVKDATANLDTLSVQIKEAEVQQIIANANRTLSEANEMLQKMQSPDSSVGKLLNTTELHDQLSQTVADIDSLINDIKENPKRYIHIKVF